MRDERRRGLASAVARPRPRADRRRRRVRGRRGHRAGAARWPVQTALCNCEPRRSDQKGGCGKNHVEIRKLLPRGRGIRFDLLTPADCALVMSQVNSETRGSLAWMTPAEAPRTACGDAAVALMDAFGIEELGMEELDLTPGYVERARAERGEAPLA